MKNRKTGMCLCRIPRSRVNVKTLFQTKISRHSVGQLSGDTARGCLKRRAQADILYSEAINIHHVGISGRVLFNC